MFAYRTYTCGQCALWPQCTRNLQSRRISRSANEHVLEQMNARVAVNPQILKKRKAIVEHPFGTIKRWMNQTYFLMRGLTKVRAEFSLSALAYNFKRVLALSVFRRCSPQSKGGVPPCFQACRGKIVA
jgi:hypothetical protein